MLTSRLCGLMLLLSAIVQAGFADDLPPEVIRLAHFKQKVRRDLSQVPNYTCLETMERYQRASRAYVFRPVDILRVEVSNVNGKELLAWPGARRFTEKDLTSFISSGMIGNGMFALHANNLFVNDTSRFLFRGSDDLDGREAIRYDYSTPDFMSGYHIRVGAAEATVSVKGSFWFDPVSLDLLRLDVYGDELPPQLGLEASTVRTYYSRTRIGKSDALLPHRAELMLTLSSGDTNRNLIAFSACREYGSESSISFDPPPEAGIAPSEAEPVTQGMPQAAEVELAAGLFIPIALETNIDSGSVSVGDAVRARVRRDVRHNEQLVLPAGTVISGRIRSAERHPAPERYFLLGLEFSDAEWQGGRAQFRCELVDDRLARGLGGMVGVSILRLSGSHFRLAPGSRLLLHIVGEQPASDFR